MPPDHGAESGVPGRGRGELVMSGGGNSGQRAGIPGGHTVIRYERSSWPYY